MQKIALVTDSTSDLTPEMVEQHNVHVMPLKINFPDQQYVDGELTSEAFYIKLAAAEKLPTTSQPAPEEFAQFYGALLEKYDEVLSIHISSGLSGTFNAARLAAEEYPGQVHLVDSLSISLGTGIMVMDAAKGIAKGLSPGEIIQQLGITRNNLETVFTLDTLEYLQKGGRIGRVAGMVGSLLNIKPVIRVDDDGIYVPAGKARSRQKALATVVDVFVKQAAGRKAALLAVAHGAAAEAGMMLKEQLESALGIKCQVFTQVGPVIGVHTGPGTIGAAVLFQ